MLTLATARTPCGHGANRSPRPPAHDHAGRRDCATSSNSEGLRTWCTLPLCRRSDWIMPGQQIRPPQRLTTILARGDSATSSNGDGLRTWSRCLVYRPLTTQAKYRGTRVLRGSNYPRRGGLGKDPNGGGYPPTPITCARKNCGKRSVSCLRVPDFSAPLPL